MTDAFLFLLLLFGFTWPWGILMTPAALPHGLAAFLAVLLPSVWAPTLIALGLTRYRHGPGAIGRELRARLTIRRGAARLIVFAAVAPLAAGALALWFARQTGDGAAFIPAAALPMAIGIQVITGATGEELGWRGFLLPRLRARMGSIGAAVAMSLLWALWHVPAFYTPGLPHRVMPMWPMLALIALFGIFLAAVFYRAGDSVWPAIAAHISLNVILAIGGVNLASGPFWMAMAALTAPIAVLTLTWRSGGPWRQEPAPWPAGS